MHRWVDESSQGAKDGAKEGGLNVQYVSIDALKVSAEMAKSIRGRVAFTSTLLVSPKKSIEQLRRVGDALADRYGIRFIAPVYRKGSGPQEQNILANRDKLYSAGLTVRCILWD